MVEDEADGASVLPARSRRPWTALVALAGLALMAAVVANAAGAAALFQPARARPAIAQSAGVTPLFRLRGMSPGRHYTACVDVAVRNPGRGARVYLSGQDVRGRLASALHVVVAAGPVSRPVRCSAFTAPARYRGTVAALGTRPAAATGWAPRWNARWRFKFTVWVAATAPTGASASVGFAWHLSSARPATPATVSVSSVSALSSVGATRG
jgi:hypothetical protein